MIKILLVDDDYFKKSDILKYLTSLGIHGPAVESVGNVTDALAKLRMIKYDIVILDLNLPIRGNDKPIQNGGHKILYSLSSERYFTPTYVLGLTQYDEYQIEFLSAFKKFDINIYNYNTDTWKEIVATKIKWLTKNVSLPTNRTTGKKVIVLTHGIMTLGKWTDKVELEFSDSEYKIIKYPYPHYSAIKIVLPWFRRRALQSYAKFIENVLINHPDCELNFISHSFGTFMTMKSLLASDISYMPNINNIILCGSVLRCDFDMNSFIKRLNPKAIINECASEDTALLLCNMTCYGLGNAGRIGFHGHNQVLVNRFYKGGHSVFFEDSRIRAYWKPIFETNRIDPIDERKFSPLRENSESILSMFSPLVKFSQALLIVWLITLTLSYYYS